MNNYGSIEIQWYRTIYLIKKLKQTSHYITIKPFKNGIFSHQTYLHQYYGETRIYVFYASFN